MASLSENTFEPTLAFAQQKDQEDPLRAFRSPAPLYNSFEEVYLFYRILIEL